MARTKKAAVDITLIEQRSLLSPEEVSIKLGICRSKVYRMLKKDILPSVMAEGMRKIRRLDLDRYINSLGEGA